MELVVRDIHDVEIREAAVAAAEDEPLAIRRPARSRHALEGEIEALDLLPGFHVEEIQHIAPFALRRERELLAIGREGALGVEQAQLLEVRIESALDWKSTR